jgi:hypothetical protein
MTGSGDPPNQAGRKAQLMATVLLLYWLCMLLRAICHSCMSICMMHNRHHDQLVLANGSELGHGCKLLVAQDLSGTER